MIGPFSTYLEMVETNLSPSCRKLVRGDLYLTVLDWFTDGIEPDEAAARIRSATGDQRDYERKGSG